MPVKRSPVVRSVRNRLERERRSQIEHINRRVDDVNYQSYLNEQKLQEAIAEIGNVKSLFPIYFTPEKSDFSETIGLIGKFVALGSLIIFGNTLKALALGATTKEVQIMIFQLSEIFKNASDSILLNPKFLIDITIAIGGSINLLAIVLWILFALWIFWGFASGGGIVGRSNFLTGMIGILIGIAALGALLSIMAFSSITFERILASNPVPRETPLQISFSDERNQVSEELNTFQQGD